MIGAVIGSYRIIEPLGEGGMGVVYIAEHELLKSRAVVKMLRAEFSDDKEIVDRFFNEAKAATSIRHPGIVKVFDFGIHAPTRSAFIVMEMLDGEPLSSRLRRGAVPLEQTLVIVRQVASALGAAHASGIVHRDLKPDNIFLVPDPDLPTKERVKILDFGIAKLASSTSAGKTRAGAVFGTPLYMSPEQCKSAGDVDLRTDIYAVGCITYEMLTGRCPFIGSDLTQLIAAHLFQQPNPPSTVSSIPPRVDAPILRALAKDPAERQQTLMQLATELEASARPGSARAASDVEAFASTQAPSPAPPPNGFPNAPLTTLGAAAGERARATKSRSRSPWLVGAGAIGVAGAVVAVVLVSRGAHDTAASPERVAEPRAVVAAVDASVSAPDASVADAPPAVDDKQAIVTSRMRSLLVAFLRWSTLHPQHPCPSLADLGATAHDTADDPWGRPMKLTCKEQPADQMVGFISAGADGVFATPDDLRSWELGGDVVDLARGARWVGAASKTRPAVAKASTPRAASTPSTPAPPATTVVPTTTAAPPATASSQPTTPPAAAPTTPQTKTTDDKWRHMLHDKEKP